MLSVLGAFLLWLVSACAQEKQNPDQPLPQDTGAAGLHLALKQLSTTARLMHTTAHPDDEDGGMLTFESRGLGTHTLLMTLTRGEGGQNKLGSSLFDSLGVLRTLELLQSDRYYGVEQRFSHVADFGFSKTADETLEKWQGHDPALGDIVRVIRTFRPDVLIARFTGTTRDGHGNHQASAILTKEAFRAAADPARFPEQIREGLLPWQAKKLYMGRLCWDNPSECEKDYTVKMNTGVKDSDLGMSYVQFALEGLRHQLSQGAAQWRVEPGDRFSYYKLVDSVVPNTTDAAGHEKSFFDGIDTTLPGLAARLGDEQQKLSLLPSLLGEIDQKVKNAAADATKDKPARAAMPLLAALTLLEEAAKKVAASDLSSAAKSDLLTQLQKKQEQCAYAANLALGVTLQAEVSSAPNDLTKDLPAPKPQAFVSPATTFYVKTRFHNGSKRVVEVRDVKLEAPKNWDVEPLPTDYRKQVEAGDDYDVVFEVNAPSTAELSRPYWHRAKPETESVNTLDESRFTTLPFAPPPLRAVARFVLWQGKEATLQGLAPSVPVRHGSPQIGLIDVPVFSYFRDENGNERTWPLPVAPVFSVLVEPSTQVIPAGTDQAFKVKVHVDAKSPGKGRLHIEVPDAWRVEPRQAEVRFDAKGGAQEISFDVSPSPIPEGSYSIRAVLASGHDKYTDGYSLITREDLGAYYYYQPAIQKLSVVDVKVPRNLKVGYIMGAGDEIPTTLQQLGVNLELIAPDALPKGDLSGFSTIVLGIRAYDTQKDVAANNQRLLDYVSNGGTLIVQYNAGTGDFNSGKFTPYTARLSRARVSVEEAPVEILTPQDSVFHFPNELSQKDFDGWIQERGLYFMDQWDDKFKPLLACNDPGEPPQKGGLLRAQYGKGTYIYSGYAFFRQLPAGVPGAVRLFMNLLAAGHEPEAAH
jgi:LmbE family N-acetylglucosaminyl deacetylase